MSEKVIVVKNKEGCFLQTLNLGCAFVFAIVGLLVLGSCWMMHKATEDAPVSPRQKTDPQSNKEAPGKIVPSSPWTTSEKIDSITDKRIITLYTTGTFLDHDDSTDPCFIIRLTTEDDGIHCETYFSLKWTTVDDCDAQIRFDNDPAFSVGCHKSTDLQGGFLDDPNDIVQKICKHRNMTIRFKTFSGETVTMDFPIRDLQNPLEAARSKLASRPLAREGTSTPSAEKTADGPPQPSAKPESAAKPSASPVREIRETTCSACSGHGTIPATVRCSKCGGAGRIYQSGKWQSCPKTITRGTKTCPTCNGTGKTSSM